MRNRHYLTRTRGSIALAAGVLVTALGMIALGPGIGEAQANPYPLTFTVPASRCEAATADVQVTLTNNGDHQQGIANTMATLGDGTSVQLGWSPSQIDPGSAATATVTLPAGSTLSVLVSLVSDEGEAGGTAGTFTVLVGDCPTATTPSTLVVTPTSPPPAAAAPVTATAQYTG